MYGLQRMPVTLYKGQWDANRGGPQQHGMEKDQVCFGRSRPDFWCNRVIRKANAASHALRREGGLISCPLRFRTSQPSLKKARGEQTLERPSPATAQCNLGDSKDKVDHCAGPQFGRLPVSARHVRLPPLAAVAIPF